MNVLEIKDLTIRFRQQDRFLPVVEGLSLALRPGEVLGLVGESGSGKTVTALAVLGLLDVAPGVIGGSIAYRGNELLDGLANACRIDRNHGTVTAIRKQPRWESAYQQRLAPIRGRRIGMIFQEPYSSLDPYFTVGEQLSEVLLRWEIASGQAAAREEALEWLSRVAIRHPERVFASYPHELSGGMCQRVMIALALCSRPEVLIADEPTTALDVTIQREIILLLRALQEQLGLAILFITHDISLVKSFADRLAVMYRGRVIETGTTAELLRRPGTPLHPFTRRLRRSMLPINSNNTIWDFSPRQNGNEAAAGRGCPFYERCPVSQRRCRETLPPPFALSDTHRVRCWLHEPLHGNGHLRETPVEAVEIER